MKIRKFESSDRQACIELFKSNIPKFFLAEEMAGFEEFLSKFTQENYWVLENEDEILACGGIGIRPPEGRLHFGMVANNWHKKGLGTKLLKFRLIKLIEIPQVTAISVDTSQHNPDFFRRFGFNEISFKENAYGPGLHRCDMRIELPSSMAERQNLIKKLG